MLGIIRNCTGNRDAIIVMPLYKSIMWPHLEYCVLSWSTQLKKDIVELDKAQRRAKRIVQLPMRNAYDNWDV